VYPKRPYKERGEERGAQCILNVDKERGEERGAHCILNVHKERGEERGAQCILSVHKERVAQCILNVHKERGEERCSVYPNRPPAAYKPNKQMPTCFELTLVPGLCSL